MYRPTTTFYRRRKDRTGFSRINRRVLCSKAAKRYRNGVPPQMQTTNNNRNPYDSSVTHQNKRTVIPLATKGSMEERATILAYLISVSK